MSPKWPPSVKTISVGPETFSNAAGATAGFDGVGSNARLVTCAAFRSAPLLPPPLPRTQL
ncbi:MAG: hypothetical protein H6718_12265 [Polyangiaceae bacterium]|nr:hypothetical protein [Myxococcales bacterium]MCB9586167.1 hypothetical protein [Polyangiaceae bacterium]MCB9606844.1 hypothetical protein [Polyangiaceae bacterium]